jgi:hypothetical protein
VDLIFERLNQDPPLPDQAVPRLQFFELVVSCAKTSGGIASLAHVLDDLDPGSEGTITVQRLADEWVALHALPELAESWSWLADVLSGAEVDDPARLVREVTASRISAPYRNCTTAWAVFLYLTGQAAAPNRPPPWMLFLDRMSERTEPSIARELKARNRKWALQWGVSSELDKQRWVSASAGPGPRQPEYLLIQINPDPLGDDSYTVSHWFQSDPYKWAPQQGEDCAVRRQDLERCVGEVVAAIEATWGDRPVHLRLEFILPMELLHLPVDWWPMDYAADPHVPLGVCYPVVVRSLDRLLNRKWHRFWRLRWDRLVREPVTSGVYVSARRRRERHLDGLEARLSDDRYVAVVLSEPPHRERTRGRREIEAALLTGYPVMIWNRTDHATAEFRNAVNDLLSEGLHDLPIRVLECRRQAAMLDPERQARHIGRQLAVLWDDPDRKPIIAGI